MAGGGSGPDYWLRVWALRGLLRVWADTATPGVLSALTDDSWRVREMVAEVAARHRIDEAHDRLLILRDDPVARVRATASKAIQKITGSTE